MLLPLKRLIAAAILSMCYAAPVHGQGQPCDARSSAANGVNASAAPVPTPLLNGKRAFISNEPGNSDDFPYTYSGSPERAYSEFIAGMKTWGRYEIVMDPKDADVVFAIRFIDGSNSSQPYFQLNISDAKTSVHLWSLEEEVPSAALKKHRDALFSQTDQLLVSDVRVLVTPGASPPVPVKSGKTRMSDRGQPLVGCGSNSGLNQMLRGQLQTVATPTPAH
jgi:hypothetical protein